MDAGFCGGGGSEGRDNLEDLGLDMGITSKLILNIAWDGMNGISLATCSGKWEALVEVVINFRFL